MKNRFITLEGIEGVGKSTHIKMLEAYLINEGTKCVVTREPGGVPSAETIRNILLHEEISPITELLLYEAARSEHFEKVIEPSLKNGATVICDRFTDATIAYQGYGRGLDTKLIEELNKLATKGIEPDLTFFIDIPVKLAFERLKQRGTKPDRFEKLDHSFYEKVRKGYLEQSRKYPKRFVVIDGSGDIEATHKAIVSNFK